MNQRHKNPQGRHKPLPEIADSDWGNGWSAPLRWLTAAPPCESDDELHFHIAVALRWLILGIGLARSHKKELHDPILVYSVEMMLQIIDQAGLSESWATTFATAKRLDQSACNQAKVMTDAATGDEVVTFHADAVPRSPDLELVRLGSIKVGKVLAATGMTRSTMDSGVESLGRLLDGALPPPFDEDVRLLGYREDRYERLVKPRLVPYGHANPN